MRGAVASYAGQETRFNGGMIGGTLQARVDLTEERQAFGGWSAHREDGESNKGLSFG